jgi:hypothetical protein
VTVTMDREHRLQGVIEEDPDLLDERSDAR